MVWHLGAEWRPVKILALRIGVDQDTGGDGAGGLEVVSDQTYGVGMQLAGLNFDYAYHTFTGAPDTSNHFFSLSYKFTPRLEKEKGKAIVVTAPPDKLITFEATTLVEGQVVDPNIRRLSVAELPVKFTLTGDFQTRADLEIGKNGIVLLGRDSRNVKVAEDKLRVLRLKPFPDVKAGYWVRLPISVLAMQKIITGYPNGTFKPQGNITRAEMCTLLMKTRLQARTLGSDTAEARAKDFPPVFLDVAPKHWASKYVKQAAELEVVKGYPDGTFKPSANITRAEGLAMIARFAGISRDAAYVAAFPDVPSAYWAAPIISGAYQAGILEYLRDQNFEPKKLLTRAETVEMLYKTQYVKDLLAKDLLDWDSY
jgi:hypothetical protein